MRISSNDKPKEQVISDTTNTSFCMNASRKYITNLISRVTFPNDFFESKILMKNDQRL